MKRLSESERRKKKNKTGECKFKNHVPYRSEKKGNNTDKKLPTFLNALTCKTHPFSIWQTVRSHQNVIVPIWRRDVLKNKFTFIKKTPAYTHKHFQNTK